MNYVVKSFYFNVGYAHFNQKILALFKISLDSFQFDRTQILLKLT